MSNPLNHYSELLRQLHGLIRDDKDEGPISDSIRDEMDVWWKQLSETEHEQVRTLSTQLYIDNAGVAQR